MGPNMIPGIKTADHKDTNNGFSFTVESELDAYKAAFMFRRYPEVKVLKLKKWTLEVTK